MNLFQPVLFRLPTTKRAKLLCISCHLHRNLTTTTHFEPQANVQSSVHSTIPDSNPDPVKVVATQLSECTNLLQLNQIYAKIIRTHLLELNPLTFYWNSIMRSYVRLDIHYMALRVFIAMSRSGVSPDSYTIPLVLKATCHVFAIDTGRQLHSVAIVHGLELNEFCESGLISLYCKAGDLMNAQRVFGQNPERKLGSWNAIIGGLAQGGHAKEAIDMFIELRKSGLRPDDVTMVSITSACGSLGDLNLALQLHKCVFQAKTVGKPDILMLNSLVDVYGKCGRMDLAYKVFAGMAQRNVSTWTSMIMGYAMHGHAYDALECFNYMREAGVIPNHVTFVGVLSACVHGGMVENGRQYFDMMRTYGFMPTLQHYGCMVDLLGRAGLLEEARKMVEEMPIRANSVIWGALMGACEKHRNVEMAEWVARHLVELEPWNDGVYVVLSNIYASAGMWEDVERIRGVMKEKRVAKTPGSLLGL
ncbi:pentatricopeptide repeat-containing protein At1g77170, mitochondrial isoform X2 [Macadamia integrifolia]|uniref:pentatricopeptide repeat-containing protein At1g77170, mitochondrial isoform X2 n=1 Tax=Macadamia integrifolia TaxID=60698 RepID=UPI001C4FDED8|nr:pentatricopeptide repeat-containing protein At1g77170, mitochondrial isoform X2 [Macadamia integrifolia]XP_042497338.1 pentatricopeptide repeat-containing protein At1g77170, mitochondrial isoform X2 [Macadamia integrifolia]